MKQFLNILFHNFWYKVAALVIAIIIWGIVQGEEVLELNRKLVVRIDVPEGRMLRGEKRRIKDITIRGPRILLGDLINKEEINAAVVLEPEDFGDVRIRVGKQHVPNWDDRLKLTVHEPAHINLFIDERSTATVAIREVLQGAPAEGHIIEKVTLKPKYVKVTGLKSELKKIREVITEPVDIDGLKQSKSMPVAIVPSGLSNAELEEETTMVTLQVGESKENKKLHRIPVSAVGSDYAAVVKPKFVSIEIQGTPGVLTFVRPQDLDAFVDIANLAPGRYEREIKVRIPPETVLIETSPEKATIEVLDQRKIN